MADGRWQMVDGGWRMADGGWQMADGKWRMADGGWRMADGECRDRKGRPRFLGGRKWVAPSHFLMQEASGDEVMSFSDFSIPVAAPAFRAMDTQLNALPTLPVLARTVSGRLNSAFLGLELNRSAVGKTAFSLVSPRPQQLTPLPCGGPARLDPFLEPRHSAVVISGLATGPPAGVGGKLRFPLLACNRSTLFPKCAPYLAIQSPCTKSRARPSFVQEACT